MKTVVLVSFFLFHWSPSPPSSSLLTCVTSFLTPSTLPLHLLPPPHLNIPDDDRIANTVEEILSLGVPGKDEGNSSLGIWEGGKHAFWEVATQTKKKRQESTVKFRAYKQSWNLISPKKVDLDVVPLYRTWYYLSVVSFPD